MSKPAIPQAVATAHGITRTGLCTVSGRHLSEAPNTPDEADKALPAADLELARRFGFGGLTEADLDPRAYHRALEKQIERPDELTIACSGGRP